MKMNPRILVVHPPYQDPAIGEAHVLGVLRNHGLAYDYHSMNQNAQALEDLLREGRYGLVGIGGLVTAYKDITDICKTVKALRPETKVVVGGRLVSSGSDALLTNMEADYYITGDADPGLPALAQAIQAGGSVSAVPNLGIRTHDGITWNAKAEEKPLVKFFPFIDEIYKIDGYFSQGPGNYPLVTCIGCVGYCNFCNPGYRTIRVRPIEDIIFELQRCRNDYGYDSFEVISNVFFPKKTDIHAFCKAYTASGLDMPWKAALRADYDLDVLQAMRDAGCQTVIFGLESADDTVLALMNKKITVRRFEAAITSAQKLGLRVASGIIIGNKGDTRASVQKTTEMIKQYSITCSGYNVLQVFPGTKLYDEALENGSITDEATYMYKKLYSLPILSKKFINFTTLSKNALKRLYLEENDKLITFYNNLMKASEINEEKNTVKCHFCQNEIQFSWPIFSFYKAYHCKKCFAEIFILAEQNKKYAEYLARLLDNMHQAKNICVVGDQRIANRIYSLAQQKKNKTKYTFLSPTQSHCFGRRAIRPQHGDFTAFDLIVAADVVFENVLPAILGHPTDGDPRIQPVIPEAFRKRFFAYNRAQIPDDPLRIFEKECFPFCFPEEMDALFPLVEAALAVTTAKRIGFFPFGHFAESIAARFQQREQCTLFAYDNYNRCHSKAAKLTVQPPARIRNDALDCLVILTPVVATMERLVVQATQVFGVPRERILTLADLFAWHFTASERDATTGKSAT